VTADPWSELVRLAGPFVHVDVGARGDARRPLADSFPGSVCVGLEADADECARLAAGAAPGYRFVPAAAGACDEPRVLNLTANAACSSLLEPDAPFWSRFAGCAEDIVVIRRVPMTTAALDRLLPAAGVERVHFLELDTQGTELEILRGAAGLLERSIVGVRVEVEFAAMYRGQALFGEIDAFLRERGFALFDLTRYRYRLAGLPAEVPTRGRVLYGQATYLRDGREGPPALTPELSAILAATAARLGFADHAHAVLTALLRSAHEPLLGAASTALATLTVPPRGSRLKGWIASMPGLLRRPVAAIASVCRRLAEAHAAATAGPRGPSWKD